MRQLITLLAFITDTCPDTCHCKLIFTSRFLQNKFTISSYNKVFFNISTTSPPWPIMPFSYDVWNVKLQLYAKGLVWSWGRGRKHFSKKFSIFYMLNSKNRVFNPNFQLVLVQWETVFVNKSRVEPIAFFIEKISFSLKLFSGHFYGQSFIKTVRGPYHERVITTCL